jgi:hypothetical protein
VTRAQQFKEQVEAAGKDYRLWDILGNYHHQVYAQDQTTLWVTFSDDSEVEVHNAYSACDKADVLLRYPYIGCIHS